MKREQKLKQSKTSKVNSKISLSFGSHSNKDLSGVSTTVTESASQTIGHRKIGHLNKITSGDSRTSPSSSSPSQQNSIRNRSSPKSPVMLVQDSTYHDRVVVLIQDYDFTVHHIDIFVDQEIEFALSKDIPQHAEHQLVGISIVKQLCFESPLLQVGLCS